MLKSFFGSAKADEQVVTVWTADWRDSTTIPLSALEYWVHPDRNVIRVGMKPNKRGRMRPAYFATVTLFKIRDRGTQMGPRVTEQAAFGSKDCRALVQEWGRNRLRFV